MIKKSILFEEEIWSELSSQLRNKTSTEIYYIFTKNNRFN